MVVNNNESSVSEVLESIYDQKDVVIRERVETDSDFGFTPRERPIDQYLKYGIINVDKPPGPTSHQVVDWIKKMLGFNKSGHAGTLDPKVSGVLPVAGEKVTRVLEKLLHGTKEYVSLIYLHDEADMQKIEEVVKEFSGEIYQKPPQRAAVKRTLRTREIHEIEVLDKKGRNLLIRIDCESGTYVRKLCQHIGYLLGTGAHMDELRRIRTGMFNEENSITLHELLDFYKFWKNGNNEEFIRNAVSPVEKVVDPMEKVWIKDSAVSALSHGADLGIPGISAFNEGLNAGDEVAVVTMKNELVGFGETVNNDAHILENDQGLAVEMEKIIISRDLYPKMW